MYFLLSVLIWFNSYQFGFISFKLFLSFYWLNVIMVSYVRVCMMMYIDSYYINNLVYLWCHTISHNTLYYMWYETISLEWRNSSHLCCYEWSYRSGEDAIGSKRKYWSCWWRKSECHHGLYCIMYYYYCYYHYYHWLSYCQYYS